MPYYDFITTIRIEADNEDEAARFFDYKLKDMDTYVSEIEEVKTNG